ncbi:unnamed protein product [Closterium sp. NIES-64]|nr:unnamed protein product [Closterium sp. NIES-64]
MAARRAANSTIGAHLRSSFIRLSRTFNPPCVADVSPHCPSSAIPSTANFSQRTAGRIQSPPLSSAAPISDRIRNFSIVAHVDHGKSTLADRLLELTGTLTPSDTKGQARPQYLDKLQVERERGITVKAQLRGVSFAGHHSGRADAAGGAGAGGDGRLNTCITFTPPCLQVERERGITVKAQTATMLFDFHPSAPTGGDQSGPGPPPGRYLLNLIDTPGHVDFSYEVSRSLAATQGVLLLVDAQQGIQAQTVANFFLALEGDLAIVPVVNKIDRPDADPQGALSSYVFAGFDGGYGAGVGGGGAGGSGTAGRSLSFPPSQPFAQIVSNFHLPLPSCFSTSTLPFLILQSPLPTPLPPSIRPLSALLLPKSPPPSTCPSPPASSPRPAREPACPLSSPPSCARYPPPPGDPAAPLRALLLDAHFDEYRGVVCHVAVVDGAIREGEKVAVAGMGMSYDVGEVGVMYPEATPTGCLLTGQVCARVNVCVGERVAVAGMGMSYDVGEVCARVNVCVGERVAVAGMGMSYDVGEVGVMYPEATPTGCLLTGQVCARVNVCVGERVAVAGMGMSYDVGEVGYVMLGNAHGLEKHRVGYVMLGMRTTREARVGDTIHHHKAQISPCPGFRAAHHMVSSSHPSPPMSPSHIWQVGYVMLGDAEVSAHPRSKGGGMAAQHMVFGGGVSRPMGLTLRRLAKAVDKLVCNDASVAVTDDTAVLHWGLDSGKGERKGEGAGRERSTWCLRGEKALAKAVNKLVCSDASVAVTRYSSAALGAGFSRIEAQGPSDIPSVPKQRVLRCTEPFVLATIVTPSKYVGPIMDLCASRRGEQKEYSFIDGMREADLVKVDVLLNGKPVDALAAIAHRDAAQRMGRKLVERLKGVLDRWV